MDTNELIKALAADTRQRAVPLTTVWHGAVGLALAVAAAVFIAMLGPRPDILVAAQTPRFLFKFAVTIILAVSAFGLVRELSRPDESWRSVSAYLAAAPALMALAVAAELVRVPPDLWSVELVGTNSMVCLACIPLIGIGPLAVFLLAMRHGAPSRPAFAGAAAGLLAGGIAATFYAAHCTDDSPLFVATWYTMAIAGLAVLGAAGADRLARW
jgi:hypothetical protein